MCIPKVSSQLTLNAGRPGRDGRREGAGGGAGSQRWWASSVRP